jgi:hypothetical protein
MQLLPKPSKIIFKHGYPSQIFFQKTPVGISSTTIQGAKISKATAPKGFSGGGQTSSNDDSIISEMCDATVSQETFVQFHNASMQLVSTLLGLKRP